MAAARRGHAAETLGVSQRLDPGAFVRYLEAAAGAQPRITSLRNRHCSGRCHGWDLRRGYPICAGEIHRLLGMSTRKSSEKAGASKPEDLRPMISSVYPPAAIAGGEL